MRNSRALKSAASAMAAILLATQALATEEVIDLSDWDVKGLYDGWSANRLIDVEARGVNGEEMGEVHDILVDSEGKLAALIIETGGFLDVGDSHVRVRWDEVKIAPGMEAVEVPLTEDNLESFSLFDGERVYQGPREWRVSNLIGDYATLTDVGHYGWVRDVVFLDGKLEAVLVQPDVRHRGIYGVSPYAYPYYGYGATTNWDPGLDVYALPYSGDEVKNLPPFDYQKIRDS